MRRAFLPALLLALLLMALTACGGSKPAATPKNAQATQPAPAARPAATARAVATTEEEVTTAEEPATEASAESAGVSPTSAPDAGDALNLSSRDAGLDKLKSYRMTWQAKWNSTEAGKTDATNWNWVEEYTAEPKALHLSWKAITPDQADKSNVMEMWQIGDTTYMMTYDDQGKGSCVSMSSDDSSSQLTKGIFSPNSLGGVSNGKLVGNETINGIPARHYKYDEKGATLAAFGKVSGDVWVSAGGGYVVKDVMNWQGGAGLLGTSASSKGDGNWTWELSNVDQPLDIKAPENCGGAAKGLPIMADATGKTQMGDMLIYATAGKIADVVAFYEKELPAAGWQAEGEPSVTDEFATLQFTRDGQKAGVTITKDNDKTQVMINVQKSE
jgi:hypothetical protein